MHAFDLSNLTYISTQRFKFTKLPWIIHDLIKISHIINYNSNHFCSFIRFGSFNNYLIIYLIAIQLFMSYLLPKFHLEMFDYIYYIYQLIGLMGRGFASGPGDQRLLKWYLILSCLILSSIRYVSRVKWSKSKKGVAASLTPWCNSYLKGSLLVTLDYSRQSTIFTTIKISNVQIIFIAIFLSIMIFHLRTVKRYKVFLPNTNNFQANLWLYSQWTISFFLNCKFLSIIIWLLTVIR